MNSSCHSLFIDQCEVSDPGIPLLNDFSKLRFLSIGENKKLTVEGILKLENPHLRHLALENEKATHNIEESLQKKMPKLKVLPVTLGIIFDAMDTPVEFGWDQ